MSIRHRSIITDLSSELVEQWPIKVLFSSLFNYWITAVLRGPTVIYDCGSMGWECQSVGQSTALVQTEISHQLLDELPEQTFMVHDQIPAKLLTFPSACAVLCVCA